MSNKQYEMYYSRADQRMYWVNSDTNTVEKSWECHNDFEPGKNEEGKDRESLPVKDYSNCWAEVKSDAINNGRAYGTFYIHSGDSRGRDIHGGGSGCANPYAPRQGWKPTYGCLRMQNEDGEELSREMIAHGNNIKLHVIEQHLELSHANTQTISPTQINTQQEQPQPDNSSAVDNQPIPPGLFTHSKDITVRVMPGDSIEKIAAMYGTTPDKVKDINGNAITGFINPDTAILVGVNANYLGYDATYTVQPGDSLDSISKRTGVLPDTLRSLNNIGDQFEPGIKLKYNNENNVLIANIDKNSGRIIDLPAKWVESRYGYNPAASQQNAQQGQAILRNTSATALNLMPEVNVPYTIKAGDTMYDMARAFNVTQDKIVNSFGNAVSGGAPGDTVYIKVRPDDNGRVGYYAQKNDDLKKISERLHVDYNDLRSNNPGMYLNESFGAGTPIYYKVNDIEKAMKFGGNPQETLNKWIANTREIDLSQTQDWRNMSFGR